MRIYLIIFFGSIVTVAQSDVYTICILAILVVATLAVFYKELVYISFDEESAQLSEIPIRLINTILINSCGLHLFPGIPVVGILVNKRFDCHPCCHVAPVTQRLCSHNNLLQRLFPFVPVAGIVVSFYLNLSTGGTIVLIMLGVFGVILFAKGRK